MKELLEQLSPRLQSWRYKFGGEPGGEAPHLDDSSWELVNVGHAWEGENTNVWYRKQFVVPDKLGGFSIAGAPLRLRVAVDDDGEIYVNGTLVQSFHWDGGYAVISEQATPGQKLSIAVRGKNKGGLGRLLNAALESDAVKDVVERARAYVQATDGARLLAQHCADKDRWHQILRDADSRIDMAAAERGDKQALLDSIAAAEQALEPLRPMAKTFTVHLLSNAHIDLAWLWPWRESIEVCQVTFSSVLNLMREFPELVYAQSQAHAYMWMEQHFPDIFRAIRKRVRQGRWEITGGMWSESDTNIPSGESLVRQFLYGKRYFIKKFGVEVKVGYLPDTFGYNWNLPQILKKAGCDYFVGTKLNSNDTNRFPHVLFWWQAPDGSRVLAYHPVKGYGGQITQQGLSRHMAEHVRRSGLRNFMELYGRGDHGGGPSREDLQEARRLEKCPTFPAVKHGTALEWLKLHGSTPDLPVWNDEMYLEYHRGTYTTQSNNKKANRCSEVLMHAAETFSSWSHLEGYAKYPIRKLNDTWRTILFNQFHDILPGSSIPEVYVDSAKDYQEIFKSGESVLSRALKAIAARVNTAGQGVPVVVFNPLSWDRTDLVEAEAPSRLLRKRLALCAVDSAGRCAPVQVIGKSNGKMRLLFVAESVPSMGYKVFWLQPCEQQPRTDSPTADTHGMENHYFRLTFDQATGSCSSILDKRNNREVLDGKGLGFDLQAFGDDGNAWDIHLNYKQRPISLDPGAKIEVIEQGPVRAVVRVTRTMGASSMQRDYILYRDIPRIDCAMEVDWHAKHVLLKCAFPLSVTAPRATYEIPYAVIERSTGEETPFEAAKFEACAQKWVDVSADGYGVSLLNNPKYGHDIKGNLMRITLLRAPTSPDPEADMGRHNFAISLYPHAGDWRAAETVRRAYEFNHPLLTRLEKQHAGSLASEMSFLAISPANAILSAVKRAEDSDELVLRWYEAHGQAADVQVTLPGEPKAACETDLLEREITASRVALSGNVLTLATRPYEIKTVRVRF